MLPHSDNGAATLPVILSVFQTKGREGIKRAKNVLAKTVSYIRKVNTFPGATHTYLYILLVELGHIAVILIKYLCIMQTRLQWDQG